MLILLIKNVDQELNSKLCTLFPDRVLPVMSSLLINNENSFGRLGRFHWCIGVSSWASYKTKILKVPSEPLKREQIKIVYVQIYNRSFLVNINSSMAYKNF